jgi:hypothetical protein
VASDGDYRIRILNALSKLITNRFSWQMQQHWSRQNRSQIIGKPDA